jgi:nucleoside permease NupC
MFVNGIYLVFGMVAGVALLYVALVVLFNAFVALLKLKEKVDSLSRDTGLIIGYSVLGFLVLGAVVSPFIR